MTETTGKKEKPYYLRQPWDILFRENKLEKVSPWDMMGGQPRSRSSRRCSSWDRPARR